MATSAAGKGGAALDAPRMVVSNPLPKALYAKGAEMVRRGEWTDSLSAPEPEHPVHSHVHHDTDDLSFELVTGNRITRYQVSGQTLKLHLRDFSTRQWNNLPLSFWVGMSRDPRAIGIDQWDVDDATLARYRAGERTMLFWEYDSPRKRERPEPGITFGLNRAAEPARFTQPMPAVPYVDPDAKLAYALFLTDPEVQAYASRVGDFEFTLAGTYHLDEPKRDRTYRRIWDTDDGGHRSRCEARCRAMLEVL
jgi:hypothetical protein